MTKPKRPGPYERYRIQAHLTTRGSVSLTLYGTIIDGEYLRSFHTWLGSVIEYLDAQREEQE